MKSIVTTEEIQGDATWTVMESKWHEVSLRGPAFQRERSTGFDGKSGFGFGFRLTYACRKNARSSGVQTRPFSSRLIKSYSTVRTPTITLWL
jgi:hypothetical protein